MEYFENLQQFVPSAGSFAVFILSAIYLVIYLRFREKIYLAGSIMTITIAFFILFEALTVKAGFLGELDLGRQFNRIEHIFGVFFFFTLPYVLYHTCPENTAWKKILKYLYLGGLGLGAVFIAVALFFPDLYISVTKPAAMAAYLQGNAAKGKVGLVYNIRNIFFALYIIACLSYSGVMLFQKKQKHLIYFALGILFAILGAVDDSLYILTQKKFILPQFHFSRFCSGLIIMIVCFLIAIVSDFVKTQQELNQASGRIKESEDKYRTLSEGVSTAIFSLSEDLKFISGNEKAIQSFSLQNELGVKSFYDIINKRTDQSQVKTDIIKEKFQYLRELNEDISFHTSVSDPRTGEPIEYQFNFRYFKGRSSEFIGEAYPRATSGLCDYIDFERIQISIYNYIVLLDDVTTRLTGALYRYLDTGTIQMIKMGLQEILMNSIEHGNLNISFDEKTKAQKENRYIDFIHERQEDPRYSNKKVAVDYLLSDKKVQYKIADEGEGFDYSRIMKLVQDKENQQHLFHGRGILMALSIFDTVKYNTRGNQVLLEKYFNGD